MTEMRCHWVREPGVGKVLIPGCWNRAVYGDDATCHCGPSQKDRVSSMEGKLDELTRIIEAIERGEHHQGESK